MQERQPKPIQHWSTFDECRFLDGLGTYGTSPGDRHALLAQYRQAMARRQSWGTIDDVAVLSYVNRLLAGSRRGA